MKHLSSQKQIAKVFQLFPTQGDCFSYLEAVYWKGLPRCPYCRSRYRTPMPKENRYHCNRCNTSYSVLVGTTFHGTKIPLQKWFLAIYLILTTKEKISVRWLVRDLKVNKDTAWRISAKINGAMFDSKQRNILFDIVEKLGF